MAPLCYRRHRFPPEIIQHAIWLYLRFTLSYRDVEELLAERGLDISYETVRRWVLKFGPAIARRLRQRRPRPSDRWHLDEMVVRIAGERLYVRRRLADPHRPVALAAARLGDRAVAISKRRSLYMPNGNPAPGPLNSRYFRPVRGKETRARRWDLQFESTSLQRRVCKPSVPRDAGAPARFVSSAATEPAAHGLLATIMIVSRVPV